MANMMLPQLETRTLELARRRRASSIRRRMKRSELGTPEVAVHVLLPKIFSGHFLSFEAETDSDEGDVSSPDSGVMVATPEGIDEMPSISLSNYDEDWEHDPIRTHTLDPGLLPAVSDAPSAHSHPSVSKKPSKACKNNFVAATTPSRLHTQTPPRPRYDHRGIPYDPETRSAPDSNESTPRMRCQDLPKIQPCQAAVDQLSGALEQLCHLVEPDDVRCTVAQTGSESRKSSIGFLEAPLDVRKPRSNEKPLTRRRLRSRGGEIAFDFGPKLKEAASW